MYFYESMIGKIPVGSINPSWLVQSNGRQNPAAIANISAKGCLCSMDRFPSQENINGKKIELLLPYGDQELLSVSGEVKSALIQETQIKLGIQCIEMDGYSQSVLATLVSAIRF